MEMPVTLIIRTRSGCSPTPDELLRLEIMLNAQVTEIIWKELELGCRFHLQPKEG